MCSVYVRTSAFLCGKANWQQCSSGSDMFPVIGSGNRWSRRWWENHFTSDRTKFHRQSLGDRTNAGKLKLQLQSFCFCQLADSDFPLWPLSHHIMDLLVWTSQLVFWLFCICKTAVSFLGAILMCQILLLNVLFHLLPLCSLPPPCCEVPPPATLCHLVPPCITLCHLGLSPTCYDGNSLHFFPTCLPRNQSGINYLKTNLIIII